MAYADSLRQQYATFTTAADLIDGVLSASTVFSAFTLASTTSAVGYIHQYSADTAGGFLSFRKSRGATLNTNTIVASGDVIGNIVFQGANGTSYTDGARIRALVSATPGASNDMPTDLVFETVPDGSGTLAERMRISNAGDIGMGRTSTFTTLPGLSVGRSSGSVVSEAISTSLADNNSVTFYARGTATGSRVGQLGVYKHSGITNPAAFIYLQEEDSGDNYLWVSNAGNLMISATVTNIGTATGTVVGTQTSDERLKNVKPGPFSYGLSNILALTPVEFELKEELGVNKLGFIAQQTQPIIPETVYNTGDAIPNEDPNLPKLGMDYAQIIPVLVKSIQELNAKIESLESRIQILES